MAGLVVDYFNSFQLEFSKMVFEPETGYSVSDSLHFSIDQPDAT